MYFLSIISIKYFYNLYLMSEIILYRIKKDLFILQEYLNNYFSKYLDEKYIFFLLREKKVDILWINI